MEILLLQYEDLGNDEKVYTISDILQKTKTHLPHCIGYKNFIHHENIPI